MITALIILTAIFVIVLILGLVNRGEMRIERNITLNLPLQNVFDYLRIVRNQDNFSVWNMTDPDKDIEIIGTDGTVGFIYKWDSKTNKNVGAGEQELTEIKEGKSIDYDIRFFRPMKNTAKSKFIFDKLSATQTKVTWGFYSPSKFPMSLMKPLFQKMLGNNIQKSLDNLKVLLEK